MRDYEKWHPDEEFEQEAMVEASEVMIRSVEELDLICMNSSVYLRRVVSNLLEASNEMLRSAKWGTERENEEITILETKTDTVVLANPKTMEIQIHSKKAAAAPTFFLTRSRPSGKNEGSKVSKEERIVEEIKYSSNLRLVDKS
jgi:hypothetical protein